MRQISNELGVPTGLTVHEFQGDSSGGGYVCTVEVDIGGSDWQGQGEGPEKEKAYLAAFLDAVRKYKYGQRGKFTPSGELIETP